MKEPKEYLQKRLEEALLHRHEAEQAMKYFTAFSKALLVVITKGAPEDQQKLADSMENARLARLSS